MKKSSVVIGVMLMLLFCTAYLLTGFFEENLYESVYDAEGFLTRTAGRLSGKAANTVTGGRVSRGNLYQTGTPHLELEVDVKPTETLYLRGFGGGEYIGGDWIRSSDEALFENMSETLDWGRWSHFINRIYYSMYYIMNDSVQKNHSPDPRTLKIVHSSGKYETTYVPYYSQRSTYYYNSDYDRMDGYVYRYFEQNEMNVDWENIIEDFEPQRDWYRAIMEAYIFEAQTAYTVVPKERLPKLVKLVEEHPLEELDEITAFILYTLQSNASYTLTPGWVALNEDIVEYFLFEGRNGYCVHFASAATLMYRLYGIPARYATGYIVSPLDFERQKDGTYRAVVTDESAHAWAEIFLENYGWTPVEVTPAADGSMAASYPGFDRTKFDTLVTKHKWDLELPEFENAGKHQRQDLKGSENIFKNIEIEWEKYRDFILVTASCLVYSLVLLPLFLDYRRLRCLWKMERMGCRKVFTELLQMLHFAGILPECDGTEPDFYRKWAAAVPSITIEEAKRFIEIISRAAYGDKQPEGAEEAFVYVVYMHTADYVCHSLGRWKKLVFKYVKVFG